MVALLKKDVLIIKKQLLLTIGLIAIFIPLLITKMGAGEVPSALTFIAAIFVYSLIISNAVSIIEVENAKVNTFLCAMTYSRKSIVISKYVFDICVMMSFFLIFLIESLVLEVVIFNLFFSVLGLGITIAYRAVFIPIELKLGYNKAKYISSVCIVAFPFILPAIASNLDMELVKKVMDDNQTMGILVLSGIMLAVEVVSIIVSIKIFENKEL